MYYPVLTYFVVFHLICTYTAADKWLRSSKVKRRIHNIEKSIGDTRLYRGLLLKNGLTALLISDSDTDYSAASLSLAVGSLSDPEDLPGLAHFCEHMLFLGTEKYPEENGFELFLSQNAGYSNASTYPDQTTYYFSVKNDSLSPALDRFAQFFLKPTFTANATGREILAVNSEHENNVANDLRRLSQLDKSLADPNHAYYRFGLGSKETLWDIPNSKNIDIRDELLKFHSKWYSSHLMYLTVLGKEDLNSLEDLVVSLFGNIKKKNVDMPYWNYWIDPIYKEEQLATKTFVAPVMDIRALTVNFLIPEQISYYKSMPDSYLRTLFEHEGPTSILSVLKKKGWSNKLSVVNKTEARGIELFEVGVDLTEEGVYYVDEIIKIIFQYVNMLKREGPQKWFHDENESIFSMVYHYKDKELPLDYVCLLSSQLIKFKLEEVLTAEYIIQEWKPNLIEDLLSYFRPDNMRVTVVAKQFQDMTDSVEKYYGTPYFISKIPPETISEWQEDDLCEDLGMPSENTFIATDFSLVPTDANEPNHPHVIHETPILRCWFKTDKKFRLPKAYVSIDFFSHIVKTDPFHCNIMTIFVKLFNEGFSEYLWDATRAGLYLNVEATFNGLKIELRGFNHLLPDLLKETIRKLMSFKVDQLHFKIFKEKQIRVLKNIEMEQPNEHAMRFGEIILAEGAWSPMELLATIYDVQMNDIEEFIKKFLSQMFMEALVYGNIDRTKATEIISILEEIFFSNPGFQILFPYQLARSREIQFEDGEDALYETTTEHHSSSSVFINFQCGVYSALSYMKLRLFKEIIKASCFNTLRTQEQLGYIVFTQTSKRNGVINLEIVVQSDQTPMYVDSRIENFINTIHVLLTSMSDEEFDQYKAALEFMLLEKPKSLMMQAAEYQYEIETQEYDFDRAQNEADALKTIVKNDIIQFYQDQIMWSGPKRRKLAVHVKSLLMDTIEDEIPNENTSLFNDIKYFKEMHQRYPLTNPFIPDESLTEPIYYSYDD